MNFLTSIFLGLVQGLAEFLPISSSGHLSLFQNFFGLTDAGMFFDVLLHLGTLIAIFVYYWKDIKGMILEFFEMCKEIGGKRSSRPAPEAMSLRRMILLIIVGTLPLFIILPIKDHIEKLYGNTWFIGLALIATGCLLYFFALGAWGCVYSYTPEVYPTEVRGSGAGWAAAFGRIGAFIAPFVVPVVYGMFGEGVGFAAVFTVLCTAFALVAVVVAVFGRETKGKPLVESD